MYAVADNKEFLVNTLKESLNWSESIVKSFSLDSLKGIYGHLLNRNPVYKAKVTNHKYKLSMVIPKKIREELGITYGDRFNIKLNLDKKELYIYITEEGKYKVNDRGIIYLPILLAEKKVIKDKDDVMITVNKNKLTLKSFSYLQ
ncbi:hypothetical protein AB0Y20_01070 [Heyndrickxia oleronia]|uniref:hypothetical protein n=1 Tax=Heyndrickxia oleronia TaxID=38875 RepID=UPI003F203677